MIRQCWIEECNGEYHILSETEKWLVIKCVKCDDFRKIDKVKFLKDFEKLETNLERTQYVSLHTFNQMREMVKLYE